MSTSTSTATVGTTVTVTGQGFLAHDPSDARSEPAMVRFDSLDGAVVATASPTPPADGGKFTVQMTVPALAPGDHVLIVTQNGTDGRPAYGTPARQPFAIAAPVVAPPPPPAAAPAVLEVPVLSQPFMTPAPPSAEALLRRAISRCKQRYSASKAKTKAGKRRMVRRRASCIRSAQRRLG